MSEIEPGFQAACTRALQRFAPAMVGAILFGVTFWNAQARLAPRPIKQLGELDPQLP